MEDQDKVTNLICWLCYSILIPALAIFLRWLATLSIYGPTGVDPLSMLRSSEVIFLAAVLVAETLGNAPDRKTLRPHHRNLVMNRAILMVLLVLSLMIFGAFTPLETTGVNNSSLPDPTTAPTGVNFPWLRTSEGQMFLAVFNLGLFLFVFLATLRARWLYWTISQSPSPSDASPKANSI